MSTRAVFGDAQPIYAEHGIATFPVTELKSASGSWLFEDGTGHRVADW